MDHGNGAGSMRRKAPNRNDEEGKGQEKMEKMEATRVVTEKEKAGGEERRKGEGASSDVALGKGRQSGASSSIPEMAEGRDTGASPEMALGEGGESGVSSSSPKVALHWRSRERKRRLPDSAGERPSTHGKKQT